MQNNTDNIDNYDAEIDLKELFLILWNKKILISIITTIAAILSVLYALSLPNIYSSHALLAPSNPNESLTSKLGAYSALAGMAMNQAGGSYGMMSHSPSRGIPRSACWRSERQCSCYEHNYSCTPYTPPAWGAPGSMMCNSIRDSGGRGGMGVVRIRFIEN